MTFPIPVTVLSGFLGSGKTTVLKHLLKRPDMAGTAVIVNEFGEVGLDDALLEATQEEMVTLPSGCICCAVRGDLVKALTGLADRVMCGDVERLDRIVIETTGLADPAPIAHTLITDQDLFRLFQFDGIAVTVDAELAAHQIEAHVEPARQIAVADRLLITKTDRAPSEAVAAMEKRLSRLNPGAARRVVVAGVCRPEDVFGLEAFEPTAVKAHAEGWLAASAYSQTDQPTPCSVADCGHDHTQGHRHGSDDARGHLHGLESFCLTYDTPLDGRKLSFALELLRQTYGERLLRLKGIVHIAGEEQPFVVHGVQHVFYPPAPIDGDLARADPRSRLVFIVKDLKPEQVRTIFTPLGNETT